jgi:hypothetical protein
LLEIAPFFVLLPMLSLGQQVILQRLRKASTRTPTTPRELGLVPIASRASPVPQPREYLLGHRPTKRRNSAPRATATTITARATAQRASFRWPASERERLEL